MARMYRKRKGAAMAAKKRAARRKAARRPRRMNRAMEKYNTPLGGASSSVWVYGKGRRLSARVLAMKRVGAPDAYIWNGGFQCGTTQATQHYYGFNSVTQGHLEDIFAISGNQSAPSRICLENAIATLSLTNITNTSAEVDLLDIVFKRDVPNDIQWANSGITYNVNGGSIPEMIQQGINAASGAAAGASAYYALGTNPWDSQVFKEYCQVVKRTRVTLASGGSHRHTSSVNLSKVIAQTVGDSDAIANFKGYTFATLVRVAGSPAYIPTGDYATLGAPSDVTV